MPAPIGLQVGPAGRGGDDFDEKVAWTRGRHRVSGQFKGAWAVEDQGIHEVWNSLESHGF